RRGLSLFQAEDGIRDFHVTGVQTCALPISELRLSDTAMAEALQRLLKSLELEIRGFEESSYLLIYAQAVYQWQVPVASAAAAYRSEERRAGDEWRSGGAARR